MRFVVTGGAGFIGSHLVELLLSEGHDVVVVDDLSSGRLDFLREVLGNPRLTFIRGDLREPEVASASLRGADAVFHLAANPEVRIGAQDPASIYERNVKATFNVLEAMRVQGVSVIGFASSSTVYGDARTLPTPEDYSPLEPISVYGASKLAGEALVSGYAHTFGWTAVSFRLANVVGPRSTHGVIYDFVQKLRRNPAELEVLGDGTQTKSYIYVTDAVEAMYRLLEEAVRRGVTYEVFNVGSEDAISVMEIASLVASEMGLSPRIYTTGGVDGGRGWRGDVKRMLLDIRKAASWGWRPTMGSGEAVRRAIRDLLMEPKA